MRVKIGFTGSMIVFLGVFFVLALIIGCSGQGKTVSKTTVFEEEAALDLGDRLIGVYDKEMSPGNNRLAIKNAYDEQKTFNIEICQNCEFDKTKIDIAGNAQEVISFKASVSGEKVIVVRDDLNNFYAKETFIVK